MAKPILTCCASGCWPEIGLFPQNDAEPSAGLTGLLTAGIYSTRMGTHPETNKRVSTLLKRQKGKCAHCKLFFKVGDIMEVDHITPRSKGGKDEYPNFQLLHRHYHDTKTAQQRANSEVCLTNTTTLRSRVRGNQQARF